MAVRLTEQGFPVAWKRRQVGDDVVEHTDGSGVSFVVVVLLELVFGDAFGDRGVYEGVVADENADVADAVAAGLEKTRSPGLSSLRSIFCPRLAISWDVRGVSY